MSALRTEAIGLDAMTVLFQIAQQRRFLHVALLGGGDFRIVSIERFRERGRFRFGPADEDAAIDLRLDQSSPSLCFSSRVECLDLYWVAFAPNAGLPLKIASTGDRCHSLLLKCCVQGFDSPSGAKLAQ